VLIFLTVFSAFVFPLTRHSLVNTGVPGPNTSESAMGGFTVVEGLLDNSGLTCVFGAVESSECISEDI